MIGDDKCALPFNHRLSPLSQIELAQILQNSLWYFLPFDHVRNSLLKLGEIKLSLTITVYRLKRALYNPETALWLT